MENLLKYQKLDEQLYKIEQKISNGAYEKKEKELNAVVEREKVRAKKLEEQAEKIIAEIENVKAKYQLNKSKLEEVLAKDIELLSAEELEKMNVLKAKIVSNLNILEKMLQKIAETINGTLSQFWETKKLHKEANEKKMLCKQKIEEEKNVLMPEKDKLKKELSVLEKLVPVEYMVEYKKKRNDNVFPVVVPLERGAFCGHCRMEQPKAILSRLKDQTFITCEHCKRFIYNKK